MSYILDALRKADAQRQSDPARGIHAQPARAGGDRYTAHESRRPWFWAVFALGVAALASLAWYLYQDKGNAQPARVAIATAPSAPVAVTEPSRAPVPAATEVLPPPPRTVPAPAPDEGPPLFATKGRPPMQLPPPAGPGMEPAPRPTGAPSNTAEEEAAPTLARPAAIAAAAATGLPADAPKIAITGGVYSNNPGQRMLIVNGQVFAEGAELGQGLVLQEIKPKSAVLTYRGARYSVSY